MEIIIIGAVILDIMLGDPRFIPHPVILIGKVTGWGESIILSRFSSAKALKWAGVILTVLIVMGSYGLVSLILWAAYKISFLLGGVASVFLMSQSLALNSLYKHAQAVLRPLSGGDRRDARQALGMMVGRDTDNLDEEAIIRGTVESIAENTVDGLTAPLLYGFLGGPALAWAYKAVNTLDSMIGYQDERYVNLGWAAARLDDLANYLPARITAGLYLSVAPFTAGGWVGVYNALRRDARRHQSPNSGFPEAAVAGALGVQLGGLNYYQGVPSYGALMGEKKRCLRFDDIRVSLILTMAVYGETVLLGLAAMQLLKGF